MYQSASIQGQSAQRGGDSSRVLVDWLSESSFMSLRSLPKIKRLRMLEVGALRVDNACSRSGLFEMERIDLHSQHPSIQEQDFMERPIPSSEAFDTEAFDLLSLSLVVNFVGDAAERGEMLRRASSFLRRKTEIHEQYTSLFPSLFLVLPAPCVTNSRYLDEQRLEDMMRTLGFVKVREKMSTKLAYYLWKYEGQSKDAERKFKKDEVRPGGSRNNFAIVLR